MSQHTEQHDEILGRWVTGDLDSESREVLDMVEECSECRERFEGLRGVVGELDASAALQREVLATADGIDDPPGLDRVRGYFASKTTARVTHLPWPRYVWSAAALLLIAVALYSWFENGDSKGEILLGTTLAPVEPVGAVEQITELRWTDDEGLGAGYYVVEVVADGTRITSDRLTEPRWAPEGAAGWRHAQWIAIAYTIDDVERDRCGATATRAP